MLKTVDDLKKLKELAKAISAAPNEKEMTIAFERFVAADSAIEDTVLQLLAANEALAGMADSLARSPRRIPFEGFPNGYEEFAMKRYSAALNAHQVPEEQVETILAWALAKAEEENPCPPSAPA